MSTEQHRVIHNPARAHHFILIARRRCGTSLARRHLRSGAGRDPADLDRVSAAIRIMQGRQRGGVFGFLRRLARHDSGSGSSATSTRSRPRGFPSLHCVPTPPATHHASNSSAQKLHGVLSFDWFVRSAVLGQERRASISDSPGTRSVERAPYADQRQITLRRGGSTRMVRRVCDSLRRFDGSRTRGGAQRWFPSSRAARRKRPRLSL